MSEPHKIAPEEEPKFADSVGFDDLFVVKGVQGIYMLVGNVNRSGLIGIRRYSDGDEKLLALMNKEELGVPIRTATVNASMLINLGRLQFFTTEDTTIQVPDFEKDENGKYIIPESIEDIKFKDKEVPLILNIKDVMNNIAKLDELLENDVGEIVKDKANESDLMKAIVPNYDPTRFKASHMKKTIKWYIWLKEELKILNSKFKE